GEGGDGFSGDRIGLDQLLKRKGRSVRNGHTRQSPRRTAKQQGGNQGQCETRGNQADQPVGRARANCAPYPIKKLGNNRIGLAARLADQFDGGAVGFAKILGAVDGKGRRQFGWRGSGNDQTGKRRRYHEPYGESLHRIGSEPAKTVGCQGGDQQRQPADQSGNASPERRADAPPPHDGVEQFDNRIVGGGDVGQGSTCAEQTRRVPKDRKRGGAMGKDQDGGQGDRDVEVTLDHPRMGGGRDGLQQIAPDQRRERQQVQSNCPGGDIGCHADGRIDEGSAAGRPGGGNPWQGKGKDPAKGENGQQGDNANDNRCNAPTLAGRGIDLDGAN